MKRFLLCMTTVLTLAAAAASAQTIKALEDGKYSVAVGDVTMTIDRDRKSVV